MTSRLSVTWSEESKARTIYDAAFYPYGVRVPRSQEYMLGAMNALMDAELSGCISFTPSICPYHEGTTAYDAYQFGVLEGKRLWRINQ